MKTKTVRQSRNPLDTLRTQPYDTTSRLFFVVLSSHLLYAYYIHSWSRTAHVARRAKTTTVPLFFWMKMEKEL